jgi:hypothetical protein
MKRLAGGRGIVRLRVGVVLVSLGLSSVLVEPGDGPAEVTKAAFNVRLRRSRDGFAVSRALQGAYTRLADPGCQAVLSDFTLPSGRSLQEVLDEQGQTGQSFLRLLLFYDGTEVPRCRKPGLLAFTQPGSRVIYICSAWFREAFELNPANVEAVIIHETLHAIGLGENPPRGEDITAQVRARCRL